MACVARRPEPLAFCSATSSCSARSHWASRRCWRATAARSPTIRIVGALYLMYLGAKMLFSKPRDAANHCRRPGAAGARRAGAAGTRGAAHQSQAAAVRAGVVAAVHQPRLSAAAAARDHADGNRGHRRHRAAGLREARVAWRARTQGLARVGMAGTRLRRRADLLRPEAARRPQNNPAILRIWISGTSSSMWAVCCSSGIRQHHRAALS